MTANEKKVAAALAALEYVEEGSTIGVGTGSTANHFIDALGDGALRVVAAVASSLATEQRLTDRGIRIVPLTEVESLPLYVDGADEATRAGQLVKGGGGALTREKIIAAVSRRFVCIVDDSKVVEQLGAFPLPVEVIPMARRWVARELENLGGRPVLRENFTTDNGNCILDVHDLTLDDPAAIESNLNQIPGVVTNGLFCRRSADLLIVGHDLGITKYEAGDCTAG